MKITTLSLFFMILFYTCLDNDEYVEERKNILSNTPFDQNVISNLELYDSIAEMIISNKNEFLEGREYGAITFEKQEQKEYIHLNHKPINKLPDYLEGAEFSIKKLVNKNIFISAGINHNSKIKFVIRRPFIAEYPINLHEYLIKDKNYKRVSTNVKNVIKGGRIAKDTMLNNGWAYQIMTERYYGW